MRVENLTLQELQHLAEYLEAKTKQVEAAIYLYPCNYSQRLTSVPQEGMDQNSLLNETIRMVFERDFAALQSGADRLKKRDLENAGEACD